jgi:hypothetical protein
MNATNAIYFDISAFLHTSATRELTLLSNGKEVKVKGKKIEDSDPELWIIQSQELAEVLGKSYKGFCLTFFGMLLTALHKNGSAMPICGICLADIYRAADEWGKTGLQQLAEDIAIGKYHCRPRDEKRAIRESA